MKRHFQFCAKITMTSKPIYLNMQSIYFRARQQNRRQSTKDQSDKNINHGAVNCLDTDKNVYFGVFVQWKLKSQQLQYINFNQ